MKKKNIFDKFFSLIALFLASPFLLIIILFIYLNDFSNPFYISERVGYNFKNFKLFKLRSMSIGADKTGVTSTSSSDNRITKIGHYIRKFKLDEIMQLYNVFLGDMSIVGPRPQIPSEVKLYHANEKKLLTIKPGITDFSSIVFSDEGDILKFSKDPNKDYNILIRPWKSKLGIFYIENRNFIVDIKLIFFTVLSIIDRKTALNLTSNLLKELGADEKLVEIAKRNIDLKIFV